MLDNLKFWGVLAVFSLCGLGAGICVGIESERKEAVKAGAAHYEVGTDGKTHFHWGSK